MDPMQKAATIANVLIESGQVSNVYLYGTAASGDYTTNDLDMIACVTDELFRKFFGRLAILGLDEYPIESVFAALKLLGINNLEIEQLIGTEWRLNLLLFPTGWLGKLAEVNEAFNLSDTDFALEIARDALCFFPKTGVFDASPASSWDYDAGDGFSYKYSLKHGCTAIIVDSPVTNRSAFFAKARELGATRIDASNGYYRYCVDFRHNPGNTVGPELYTFDEVFGTIVNIPEPAHS
jgi:predicted nucleotidyltransferase